jgi:hypothetical protein
VLTSPCWKNWTHCCCQGHDTHILRTKRAGKANEGRGHAILTSTQPLVPSLQNLGSCLWPQVPHAEGWAVKKLFSPLSTENGKHHNWASCSSVSEWMSTCFPLRFIQTGWLMCIKNGAEMAHPQAHWGFPCSMLWDVFRGRCFWLFGMCGLAYLNSRDSNHSPSIVVHTQ